MQLKWKMKISPRVEELLNVYRVTTCMQAAVTTTAKKLVDTLSMKPTPHKTGNLWRSMAYEVKLEGQIIRAQITAKGAPYWFWQNFGTRRIEAKHFVEKAIDKVQPDKMVAEEFYKLYKK